MERFTPEQIALGIAYRERFYVGVGVTDEFLKGWDSLPLARKLYWTEKAIKEQK